MSFLYPYFLLLGLAIVIPIVVHLFNFHRFKQVLFTNVSMLKNIAIANKKHNKLLQRLLLLSRCLAIIFLALLFAQPYIKNNDSQLKGEDSNAVVIILDNSFSMQNLSKKGSALQTAKSKTEEILKEYSDNDVFCLLTMDLLGKHKHFVSKKTFMEFLKQVEVSPSSHPYSTLINTAHHLLSLRNEANKRVFFVSDFQISQTDLNNIKADSTIQDVFLPLQIANINNIYVDSLSFDRNIYQKGQKVSITVRIKNASDENIDNVPVKLFIDDVQQSMLNVSLSKHSSTNVDMSFVIKNSGVLKGKVQILDSPITYDDDFYFAMNINDKIKVLSLNGTENKYLDRLFNNSDEVQLDNMPEHQIDFSVFAKYNVIILSSLSDISSGLANELNSFREKGGSLIIIPPINNATAPYSSALTSMHLPSYQSMVEKKLKVNALDDKNPLYKAVFSSVTENMPLPEVKKYYKISKQAGVARQDIMTLTNGDDFLVESATKTSKTFMFAVPFSEKFSDFTSQSIFVPTLWNMVLYSEKLLKPFMFMNDNSFMDLSLFADNISSETITINNDNKSISVVPQMLRQNNRLGFKLNYQIKQAGIFGIEDKGKKIGAIAINYPREESELMFHNSSSLNKELKKIGLKDVQVFNNKKMISTYFAQSNKKFDFTFIILVLLLLCLICEGFLLWKMKKQ